MYGRPKSGKKIRIWKVFGEFHAAGGWFRRIGIHRLRFAWENEARGQVGIAGEQCGVAPGANDVSCTVRGSAMIVKSNRDAYRYLTLTPAPLAWWGEGPSIRGGGEMDKRKKVRAFEVDPAPLNDSRGISKARGATLARAFEERSAPLNYSRRIRGDDVSRDEKSAPSPLTPLPRGERESGAREELARKAMQNISPHPPAPPCEGGESRCGRSTTIATPLTISTSSTHSTLSATFTPHARLDDEQPANGAQLRHLRQFLEKL